ncbi:hypothetical protein CYMTET_47672 [Cymbomonas tetramitiformis]|uniref:glucan endo-1,3-beta-D-glucosidase n=1 Tax=Cymbomonas tetramitiformis TaxID=36881 RepID=A0AAE0EWD8_9CHLO|nr:hypothetical protein CYMTET_47672 [Cymbomonas tetramitiformis]
MSKVLLEESDSNSLKENGLGYVSSVPYHVRALQNVSGRSPDAAQPDQKSMSPKYLDGHDEGVNVDWNADNFTGWCFGYIRSSKDNLFNETLSEFDMSGSILNINGTNEGSHFQNVFSEYPARMHDMCVRFDASVTIRTSKNITDSGTDLHGEIVFSNGAVVHLTRGSPVISMELPVGVTAKVTPLFYDLALAPPSHYESGRSALPEAACELLEDETEPYASDVVMWSDTNTSYYQDSPATSYRYGYLMQHFSSTHEIVCKPTFEEYEEGAFDNVTDPTCVVKTNSGLEGSMKKACCNCCPTQCYAMVQPNGATPALLRFAFYTNPSSAQTILSYSDYYVAGADVLIEEQTNHLVYEYKTKPTSDPTQEAVVDQTREVLLGAMHHHVNSWADDNFPEIEVYNHNRTFECYSDPAQPRVCKDIMRHVGDSSFVRGAHDGRLHYTTATVWHMNVTDLEVPDPNTTIQGLNDSQRRQICDIFQSEEYAFNSRDPTLYMLGKYTYRMSRVLFIAESLQCGQSEQRESLQHRVHHGLMRFLDGKYPYYSENMYIEGYKPCQSTGQCAEECEEGCVHKSGLRYDDNGWGGIIIDGNYGDSRNDTTYNDCQGTCSIDDVITYDKSADFGHKHYNDHHYHFGYMIASIALYANTHRDFLDEIPASPRCPNATGDNCPTVKDKTLTLIKEIANHDYTDPYFPQARHKDMYDWASWAGAIEDYDDGLRNQEATVEGYVGYYGTELIAKLLEDTELILWTRLLRGTDQHAWNSYRWFLPEVGYAPQKRFGGVSSYSEVGLVGILSELKWSSALFWACDPDCYPHRFACYIAINLLPLIPGVTEKYYDPQWATYIKENLGDPALQANFCDITDSSQELAQGWRNYVHAFNALTLEEVSTHRETFLSEANTSTTYVLDNGMSRMDTLVWFYNIENSLQK